MARLGRSFPAGATFVRPVASVASSDFTGTASLSGSGTLSGSAINWSASGLVSQGGVNCPFTFSNSKATIDDVNKQVVVTYSGSVCGIPVSGTENVAK